MATTVLFVEDHFELRAIHSAYLERHGYDVVTASDGDAAIDMARVARPDVIILDHSLPRRNGVEVARMLHSDPAFAAVPIVMLTAHTYGAVGRKARDAGCAAFLNKPISPSRLLEEVRRFTRPARA
jgi:CheY-like chemotaxis protein